jgi:hypothetical protein
MKHYLILSVLCIACAIAWAETMWDKALTLNAVTIAANTTNANAGTAQDIPGGVTKLGLWVTAKGGADATGGTGLTVKFSIYNGTTWTDAATSPIKVTISTLGNATKTQFDWVMVPGATQIRVGQVENTFGGALSNLAVRLSAVGP